MEIFGVKISKLFYKDFFNKITQFKKQNIVFTPNPEILLKTRTDKEFKSFLEKADYLTPDGVGLYIACQIKSSPLNSLSTGKGRIRYFLYILGNILFLPYYFFNLFFRRKYLYEKYGDRICGSDLTKDLIDFASMNNVKVAIIDLYNPTDLKKVESQKVFPDKLKQKFPKLDFDYYIYNTEFKDKIIYDIKNSGVKILFSTLGMKKQEESIIEIMEKCPNIKLGLGIGSSFDYFIGFQKRAPKVFRSLGLEWLYRMITGPKKLDRLKRLWNAIFVFIWKVIKTKD